MQIRENQGFVPTRKYKSELKVLRGVRQMTDRFRKVLNFKLGHCKIQIRPQGVKVGQHPAPYRKEQTEKPELLVNEAHLTAAHTADSQSPQTSPSNLFFSWATGLSARRARAMGVSPNSEANRTMSLAALFEVETSGF
jgi:hypothetical protein